MQPPSPIDSFSSGAEALVEFERWLENDAWLRRTAASLVRRDRALLDANDVAQETWLSALLHARAGRYSGGRIDSPRRWLAKVAGNVARQERRAAVRRQDHEQAASATRDETCVSADSASAIETIERRRVVLDAVEALPESIRTAVVLHHLQGHDVASVARRLDIPKETARSRLKRGRALLRERLAGPLGRGGVSALIVWLVSTGQRSAYALTRAAGPLAAMNVGSKAAMLPVVMGLVLLGAMSWTWLSLPAGDQQGLEPSKVSARLAPVVGAAPATRTEKVESAPPTRVEIAAPSNVPVANNAGPPSVATVRGFVVGVDGRAIAHASVGVPGGELSTRTDALGSFQWPVEATAQRLHASMEGMVTVLAANVLPTGRGNGGRELTIVVASSIRLAGVVECRDGSPAARAKLDLRLDEPWSSRVGRELAGGSTPAVQVITDAQGRFDLSGVPAIEGTLIWIEHSAGRALYGCPMATTLDLRLALKKDRVHSYPTMACRFIDPMGRAITQGTVVIDEWDKALSPDGTISIPRSIVEDFASFDVFAPGQLPSRVKPPGADLSGPDARVLATAWPGLPATRASTAWPDELTIVLMGGVAPMIQGRVMSPAGVPLGDHPVWLLDPSPFREFADERLGPIALRSDEDGRFQFFVLADRSYAVAATSPKTFRRRVEGDLHGGDHAVEIVLPDTELRGRFDGRCVAPDGTPLADVTVAPIYARSLSSWSSDQLSTTAVSGEDGRFSLEGIHMDVSHLECEGRAVMPETIDVMSRWGQDSVEVTLARRASVKFDATAVTGDIDYAVLVPTEWSEKTSLGHRELAQLTTLQWIANGSMEGYNATYWAELAGGLSAPFTVAEGTYEARLIAAGEILGRQHVQLEPGVTRAVVFAP